jgi:hypothetical protein
MPVIDIVNNIGWTGRVRPAAVDRKRAGKRNEGLAGYAGCAVVEEALSEN